MKEGAALATLPAGWELKNGSSLGWVLLLVDWKLGDEKEEEEGELVSDTMEPEAGGAKDGGGLKDGLEKEEEEDGMEKEEEEDEEGLEKEEEENDELEKEEEEDGLEKEDEEDGMEKLTGGAETDHKK